MAHARYHPKGMSRPLVAPPSGSTLTFPGIEIISHQPSDLWPMEARRLSGLREACS
jgi:hypothetical protein